MQGLSYTSEVAKATAGIYEKVQDRYSPETWETLAPYIVEINRLKREKNAVILAHNYMTPDIFHGVGDFMGDSLALAQEAARTKADIIVQCGVHFMAETSKVLCPEKKVLIPDLAAGCSLSESITAADIRALKAKHSGVPVITYVNTSAEVKAESDVCCTSGNALKIVNALGAQGHDTVIMTPDKFLAQNTAAQTNVKIIFWNGTCMVHERFTVQDIKDMRAQYSDIVVMAHPECPPDVIAASDYAGSTAQMDKFIKEKQPKHAMMITECSMSHNLMSANPGVKLLGSCQMCPHMKRITLPKILACMQTETPEVIIDPAIIPAARRAVERMLELS